MIYAINLLITSLMIENVIKLFEETTLTITFLNVLKSFELSFNFFLK